AGRGAGETGKSEGSLIVRSWEKFQFCPDANLKNGAKPIQGTWHVQQQTMMPDVGKKTAHFRSACRSRLYRTYSPVTLSA
ncbi:MAG TPA: hypothetical protein PKZ24_05845, partial [Nitrospirales bacterium]|nr:hypothetical protein [Nitrospirales bacterium]